ncbi:alpha-2-macroglobulin family protein [Moheibacter sediminis]|nr:alpha-2-macroglobulin family protein [Moheibacter sediminis]
MAQKKFDYDSKWKQIEKQEQDGLLKSTLPAVDEIYSKAKKDKNSQQIIRAMLYQSKIVIVTSDKGDIEPEIITKFKNEIAEAKPVEKAFLHSMLAEMLYQYYQQNQWEIGERTNIEEATTDDLRYWTENTFRKNISELYLASIKEKEILKKEDLKNWESVLNKEEKNRNLRPTLYDLLAHRAISYFSGYTNYDYYPMEVIAVETDEGGNEINSTQSKTQVVQILKDLIIFHTKSNNRHAQLYNELELLKFQRNDYKDAEFEQNLTGLVEKFPDTDYTPNLLMELADFYLNQVPKQAESDFVERKKQTEKSLKVLDKLIDKFPKSDVSENAKLLKRQILKPDFNLQIENYVSPEKTNPMSVSQKNLDKIYFKILKFKDAENVMNEFQNAAEANRQKVLNNIISKFPLEKEFSLELKSFDDYQQHATTAKFEPLKSGKYLVLASNNPDFKVNDDFLLQYQFVNVSAYSIVTRDSEILVTERDSGKPVSKKVEVYEQKGKDLKLLETVTTNANGIATVKPNEANYRYYNFKIQGEDVMYNSYAYKNRERTQHEQNLVKFFTDRAIYRPGQTVYFKAILYNESTEGKKKVIPNQEIEITLGNPNGEDVSNLKLKSNEFGSVSGEFIIPTSGITGQFYLEDNLSNYNGSHYFSVEEYKRPKFEVEFEDVKDTFKLDEEVTSKGKAIAYSGATIDNAKVVYRVYRQTIYPYWPWWKRGYIPYGEPEEEITQGETTTDSDGKFEIKFNAKPAQKNSLTKGKEEPRTYNYRVIADITDINGETRSSEQSITVGDLRYMLSFNVSDKIEISQLGSIQLITNNLNGVFTPAKGQITLTKINPPQRVLRESPIPKGDYELYSKEEFIQYFPHDAYGKENQKENWQKENPVVAQSFDTEKSKSIKVNPANWKEGYYVLKGWIIDGKDSIQTEKLVYLFKNDKKQPTDNELFALNLNKNSYKPGETAQVQIASAANDSEVLVELEHDGKIIKTEKIKLNNNVNKFSFTIDEKYRGNVFVHYYFGKFNTAKQGTLGVNVPHEDKSLTITAGTLRDKLQPGQKETWELTVSGKDKDKFLAEMLATMYDASLDQFKSNNISFPMNVDMNYSQRQNWNTYMSFSANPFRTLIYKYENYPQNYLAFDELNWFGFNWNYGRYENYALYDMAPAPARAEKSANVVDVQLADIEMEESNYNLTADKSKFITADGKAIVEGNINMRIYDIPKQEKNKLDNIVARRALQETAFFYPNLKTDEKGNIKIQFTVPESLTEWKFMATAHTPELRTGYFETTVRTQKDLMVVPNPPRFLREGDQITFSSKVTNLSDKELSGQAKLLLFDAFTMQPVDVEFGNNNATQNIKVAKGNSANVSWNLKVPTTHQAIVYRVVASAGDFSDGEESALPILSNRMMVTETLPIYVRENQNKTFTLEKLKNNKSESLDNFKLTFEMTTNPIWYAIFSLPYLREYPYECSEQVFSRFYGNMISQHIINSNPKIKTVFDDWNKKGELVSKLEQNEELKSLLLEETPWVRDAQSEEEQMKRIAVLFDLNKMQNELQSAFQKLKGKQYSSGGFPWFEGGQESRYITTHIVSGLGHLKAMGIDFESKFDVNTNEILEAAIRYMDAEMEKEFDIYLKNNKLKPSNYNGIQYLYARSYFLKEHRLDHKGTLAQEYFIRELDKNKFEESLQTQAMLALIYHRFGHKDKALKLLNSIKDNAVQSDEMGMYWKSNVAGWYWYQAPIETQSLLIEAFDEVLNDVESVESMKVWLLKNRQTNQWESTKATTEAVFALMSTGKDWTNAEDGISLRIGNENLDLKSLEKAPQSGSGYVKTSWNKEEIKPEMATINVQKTSPGVAWGALYWQYFEDLDKITTAQTGVKFNKQLFIKKNSDKGPVLTKITENTPIQIGDLITVRLEILTDREMEFIHIKDMRASGFEPLNVLSTYKRQGRLGYYESTRDAATNFFIDYMPKGTYVFEYDVRANNAGNFSNGITSLQNMYAPELSAHSEGIRVEIK